MRQRHYIFIALCFAVLGVTLPESAVAQYYPERKLVRDGNKQFEARNYNNSLKKYDEAYLKDSTKYEVLYNRANGYYQKKANTPNDAELTYETSNALYEKIAADTLLTDVQRAEIYRNLGETLFSQQEYEAALNSFRESLRLNPSDKETKYDYVLTKRIVDQKRAAQNQNQNQNQEQNQNQNQDGGGENNQNNENPDQNKDGGDNQQDNQSGNQNQNQQNDGDIEQGSCRHTKALVVEAADEQHHSNTHRSKERLSLEIVQRVAVDIVGRGETGREHHHKADAEDKENNF